MELDPLKKYDGFSFWDIGVAPLARAVKSNLGSGATFLFNLNGEMGTSMFGFSKQWLEVMGRVRGIIGEGGSKVTQT